MAKQQQQRQLCVVFLMAFLVVSAMNAVEVDAVRLTMKAVKDKQKGSSNRASTSITPKSNFKAAARLRLSSSVMKKRRKDKQVGAGMQQQENNRGSPMMITKLYKHMSTQQRQMVDRAGFGGLLNCSFSQVVPELCNWLLDCYDPDSGQLVFPGRGCIPITETSIHRVLGIPMGAQTIKFELLATATSFMQQQFGISKGNQPKISQLLAILKAEKRANPNFLRAWTLLAACSLITPTFSTKVSPRLYPAVIDSGSIWNKNWCEVVIRVLKQSRQPEPKKHGFKPCLTMLMILYLDSLQHGLKRIPDEGCRVTVWTTKLIKKAIDRDKKPDGTFGALQLKTEFAAQDNLFFGKPLSIDSFINDHVPESFGPQERYKAKNAVQQMCIGFSKLVSNFLQDFYQPTSSIREEQVTEEENIEQEPENGQDGESGGNERQEQDRGNLSQLIDVVLDTENEGAIVAAPAHNSGHLQDEDIVPEGGQAQGHQEDEAQVMNCVPDGGLAPQTATNAENISSQAANRTFHHVHIVDGKDILLEDEIQLTQAEPQCQQLEMNADQNTQGSFGSFISLGAPTQQTQAWKCTIDDVDIGAVNSVLEVTQSIKSMDLHSKYTEKRTTEECEIHEDLGIQLADSVSKLKFLKRKRHETVFSVGEGRDGLITKVQGKTAEDDNINTGVATLATAETDAQERVPLEVHCTTSNIARVLSFNCTASGSDNEKAKETTPEQLQPLIAALQDKTIATMSFEPPSFDLGISDASSQEKNNKGPVAAALVPNSTSGQRKRSRMLLQLPSHDSNSAIEKNAPEVHVPATKGANDAPELVIVGSQNQEDAGGNKHTPICVGSQSQEDGLESRPIQVDSQSQDNNLQTIITTHDAYIPDDVLLQLDVSAPTETSTQPAVVAPTLSDGITPAPHVRHQRVTKPAPAKKSPYINYTQKLRYVVSTSEQETYNKIIRFGRGNRSKKNSELIVNYGNYVHTTLGDFADALKPRGELSNETADCMLHILADKLKGKSRKVLSHRIATFAMSGQLNRTEMRTSFNFDKRLDHYQLIFFPVLEAISNEQKHWFLIVLNLKARRFEVMDSIRGEHDKDLLDMSNKIVTSIKILWKQHHAKSSIDINNFDLLYVDAPKQDSLHDCGFYMLKYIEYWDGKILPQINQSDMPNVRVKYMNTMLNWKSNLLTWHQVLK